MKQKFFPMWVLRHVPRLPREVVNAASLAASISRWDRALGDMVWCEVSLPMAGSLEVEALKILSHPSYPVTKL